MTVQFLAPGSLVRIITSTKRFLASWVGDAKRYFVLQVTYAIYKTVASPTRNVWFRSASPPVDPSKTLYCQTTHLCKMRWRWRVRGSVLRIVTLTKQIWTFRFGDAKCHFVLQITHANDKQSPRLHETYSFEVRIQQSSFKTAVLSNNQLLQMRILYRCRSVW